MAKLPDSLVFEDEEDVALPPSLVFEDEQPDSADAWVSKVPQVQDVGTIEGMKQAYRRGDRGTDLDIQAWEASIGTRNWEDVKASIDEFRKEPVPKPKNLFQQAMFGAAETVPGMLKGWMSGKAIGLTAAGATAIAGQAGPQVLIPEEIITVPAAYAAGATAGGIAYWQRQGAGMIYATLREEGVSHGVASAMANSSGFLYAMIEYSQVEKILPGSKKVVRTGLKKTAREVIRKGIKRLGINLTSEIAEEDVQELTADFAERGAKVIENVFNDKNLAQKSARDTGRRLWETTKQSALTFPVLLGPGAAVNVTQEIAANRLDPTAVIPSPGDDIPETDVTAQPETLQFDDEAGEVVLPETLEFEEKAPAVAEEVELPESLEFEEEAPPAEVTPEVAEAPPVVPTAEIAPKVVPTEKVAPEPAEAISEEERRTIRGEEVEAITRERIGVEKRPPSAKKILGIKPAKKVTVDPRKALKVQVRMKAKATREGFAAGWREARTALNVQMKAKTVEAKDVRAQIVAAAQELPAAEKGRILGDLARIQTKKGLARVLTRIDKIVETSEKKRAQGQLKGAAKKAKKAVGELRPEFKSLVQSVLNALDPAKPTKGTLTRLLSRQQFLEANPDTNIPEYALREIDRLSRKPIADMTADEADATRLTIESLIAQDQLKRQIVNRQWEREREAEVNRLVEALGEAETPTEEVRGTLTRGRSRIAEVKKSLAVWHAGLSRMNRILRDLDGGEPGAHTELFWRKVQKATDKQKAAVADKQTDFVDAMAEEGINVPALSSKLHHINDRLDMYSTEKIAVFLATQDQGKMQHMATANNLTEQDIQDVVDSMTEDELFVAAYLLKDYADYYPKLAKVHLELTQQELPQIEGYSPIVFDDDSGGTELDLFDEIMTRAYATSRATVEKGFTKKRVGGSRSIRLDAIGNYLNNIQRFERYKAFALPLRDMTRLATDQTWRDAVRAQENGDVVLAEFDKWLEDAAGTGPAQVADKFGRAMNWLRRNTAVSKIGLNILSTFRAGISMFHSIGHGEGPVTLWYHTTAMAEMVASPTRMVEAWDRAREILPELKLRFSQGIDRELREIAEKQRTQGVIGGKFARLKGGLSAAALFHYKVADGITVTIATLAHYNQAVAEGLTHEQATERARTAIEQTQPMGDIKDLPGLWRGSPTAKLFTMFQNMINQEYNILFRDIPAKWRSRKPGLPGAVDATGRMMWAYAWSKLIPGFFLSVIARGRLPKKDELIKDMLLWHILPIWPLGPIASAIQMARGDLPIPSLSWFRDLTYGVKAKKWATRFKSFARGLSTILGIPWSQPQRTVKGIIDLSTGKTDDWRRLIWSEYAMREPKGSSRKADKFVGVED